MRDRLQAWYAVHPPKRGKWWATTRPYVHQVQCLIATCAAAVLCAMCVHRPAAETRCTPGSVHDCWLFAAQGFLRSWGASGFCDKVVNRITEIVLGLKDKKKDVRIFVTGDCRSCNPLCCIGPHCVCVRRPVG
jgi:hypothetical protein